MVFGKVLKGQNTVRLMENTKTGANDKPLVPVIIAACGELAPGEDDGADKYVDPSDPYPDYPDDLEVCLSGRV